MYRQSTSLPWSNLALLAILVCLAFQPLAAESSSQRTLTIKGKVMAVNRNGIAVPVRDAWVFVMSSASFQNLQKNQLRVASRQLMETMSGISSTDSGRKEEQVIETKLYLLQTKGDIERVAETDFDGAFEFKLDLQHKLLDQNEDTPLEKRLFHIVAYGEAGSLDGVWRSEPVSPSGKTSLDVPVTQPVAVHDGY